MSKNFISFLEQHFDSKNVIVYENPPNDVGEYTSPSVSGRVDVYNIEQVIRIIKLADQFDGETALSPYSTGYNWGLGSTKSPSENTVQLKLSGLNKIREINVAEGYAVIEPGVTQGALSRKLLNTYRYINVTASSAETSFLGNTLDRGVGLRHQRTEDLLGLEIVLANGTLHRVGWWPEQGKNSALYSHGLGPSLVQLFSQSNLGVITGGVVRLLNRPEKSRVAYISFAPENLDYAINTFQRWSAQGLIHGVLKIYDETSTLTYGANKGEFLVHLPLSGAASVVSALSTALETEFLNAGEKFTSLIWSDSPTNPYQDDIVANLVAAAYQGDTKYHDTLLEKTLGATPAEIDAEGKGWIFFLPLLPFTGQAIKQAYLHISDIFETTGVRCGATINALNDQVIDLVVSIRFERVEEEINKAHQALELLHEKFSASGFYPYRLDVEHPLANHRNARTLREGEIIRSLQKTLDPKGIFASGRYSY
jgi:4-cresol dehydrogenase (hydroxylating)